MISGPAAVRQRTASLAMLVLGLVAGAAPVATAAGARMRGPRALLVEPGGTVLVLCEKSGSLLRLDPATGGIVRESEVGVEPFAMAASPDRTRLFVTCRRGQEVVEIDPATLEVRRRIPARGDPTGVAMAADGKRLYVALHSLDRLVVFDLESGAEIKRLVTGNGPQSVVAVPALGRVFVTNLLAAPVPQGMPCAIEITVVDDATARIAERISLPNANVGRQIAFTSDGARAVAAISRPKNLVPMVQVARGWVVTNAFAVLYPGSERPPLQLLVDLPNQAYADPYAVVITPDDRKGYLTAAGYDTVIAIDLGRVDEVAADVDAGRIPGHANHLGLSRRYVTARIPVGANPEGLAVSPDGRWLYVANRLDDSLSVIDASVDRVERTLSLGGALPEDSVARGERLFHNAARTFHDQFTCASCHPDGGLDGLRYDMEPDGVGQNIIDNRNMRDVFGTGPFKWIGTNPDIATQCGTRTAKWIVRTGWLNSFDVVALTDYIHSLPPVINPYRDPSGELNPVQEAGRELFFRTTRNDGTPIPERDRCDFCHAGPKFTNHEKFDVGTMAATDSSAEFDTAHLTNIFESAPYLHDGRALTLEEIWTKYNPEDKHGISSDWTKIQLNDLVEYLKALGPAREETP